MKLTKRCGSVTRRSRNTSRIKHQRIFFDVNLQVRIFWTVILTGCAFSCATYYEINAEFNYAFQQGNLESAERVLNANKRAGKGKVQFLYFANQGVVNAMLGNLEESNEWFEKAYIYGEDYYKNVGDIAVSFLTNPNSVAYSGEDHEQLLLLYYKAINLLKMKEYEAALIECRRLNNRLNELSDKYKSDNKYKRDAFIHNLMGIIYETTGNYNNAFIAYRNAYNIYEEDYKGLFGLDAPHQLKEDLLRAAALTGFTDQLDFYERKFNIQYKKKKGDGELVFLWHNGLGPIKDEWSVNFTAVDGGDGIVTFVNEDYNFSFPYSVSSPDQKSELTDIRVLRITFPKYVERKTLFDQATLAHKNNRYQLEMAEDINAIAFKTLEERMLKEFGKGLLRAAVKKSLEMVVRGEQSDKGDDEKTDKEKREESMREGLAFLVGIANAVTEKADTRNWQTLPHGIYYTRIPLDTGMNKVTLRTESTSTGRVESKEFTFNVSHGETVFHTYQSLETRR